MFKKHDSHLKIISISIATKHFLNGIKKKFFFQAQSFDMLLEFFRSSLTSISNTLSQNLIIS